MSELQKLVIVSVEDSEISTKLQVAKEDYSAMFDAVAYKQQYNKDTEKYRDWETDRKSTRLNSSHSGESRMPSSA